MATSSPYFIKIVRSYSFFFQPAEITRMAPPRTVRAPIRLNREKVSGSIHETCILLRMAMVTKVIIGLRVMITLTLVASVSLMARARDP